MPFQMFSEKTVNLIARRIKEYYALSLFKSHSVVIVYEEFIFLYLLLRTWMDKFIVDSLDLAC